MAPNKNQASLLRKLRYKRNVQKFIVLPTSLLVLNALEEVITYKSAIIGDPYARTGALMAAFFVGFGLFGFVLSPLTCKALEHIYYGGRKSAGYIGEIIALGLLYAGLFYVYYQLYATSGGVKNLLPEAWHNHHHVL